MATDCVLGSSCSQAAWHRPSAESGSAIPTWKPSSPGWPKPGLKTGPTFVLTASPATTGLFGKEKQTTKAEVIADVTFVPPDVKQYAIRQANGMGLGEKIVRQMLEHETDIVKDYGSTDLTPDNYDFRFVREEELSGQRCYVLEMLPKRKGKTLLRGQIWVDATTYQLRRTEGEPGKAPSWWLRDSRIVLEYGDVGGMWLQTASESTANVRFVGPYTMVSHDVEYKISELAADAGAVRPSGNEGFRRGPIACSAPSSPALVFLILVSVSVSSGYSVLTHEAIVDSLWDTSIQKMLLKRFPAATPEELEQAHAYVYGGCIIQDMGYYPFSSHLFSDLTHYVRSGDFIVALIRESQDINEYAFALGALAHYAADNNGHRIATNLSVPILYPKLRRKFGQGSDLLGQSAGAHPDGVRLRRPAGRARALRPGPLPRVHRL